VLRLLLTRRWLGALLGAVVFAFVAYHLGWWQYHRHEAKVERNRLIDQHYTADPVDLPAGLTGRAPLPAGQAWLRVRVSGTYADEQLLVRNRPRESASGYEAVTALRLADGRTILADRGWVPASREGAATLPDVAPPPTGTVTVVGWLRPTEPSLHRDRAAGTLASINTAEAGEALGTGLLSPYLIVDTENADGSTPPRPLALEPPDEGLGPHLAYAYQWWLGMSAGFVLVWLGLRRELRDADPSAAGQRPRKVRIWDEEDE
jgi:cytochrome oxidase assembly protein ShyY1